VAFVTLVTPDNKPDTIFAYQLAQQVQTFPPNTASSESEGSPVMLEFRALSQISLLNPFFHLYLLTSQQTAERAFEVFDSKAAQVPP